MFASAQDAPEVDTCAEDAIAVIADLVTDAAEDSMGAIQLIYDAAGAALRECGQAEVDATPIPTDEAYSVLSVGCVVGFDIKRGTGDVRFTLYGEENRSVLVDIIAPDKDEPEAVAGQLDKEFIDTGELYIHQYYTRSKWPLGTYIIMLEKGDEIVRLSFDMAREGDYNIYVYCV